jgi:hypothetical protein
MNGTGLSQIGGTPHPTRAPLQVVPSPKDREEQKRVNREDPEQRDPGDQQSVSVFAGSDDGQHDPNGSGKLCGDVGFADPRTLLEVAHEDCHI